jgi:hypothetical protein
MLANTTATILYTNTGFLLGGESREHYIDCISRIEKQFGVMGILAKYDDNNNNWYFLLYIIIYKRTTNVLC